MSQFIGFVYFVAARGENRIKIGYTRNVERRLSALQTGSGAKLDLLASCPGSVLQEQTLHAYLREYRLQGEWFVHSAAVARVIRAARYGVSAAICRAHRESFPPEKSLARRLRKDVRNFVRRATSDGVSLFARSGGRVLLSVNVGAFFMDDEGVNEERAARRTEEMHRHYSRQAWRLDADRLHSYVRAKASQGARRCYTCV